MQPDNPSSSNMSPQRNAERTSNDGDSRTYGGVETRLGKMGRPVLAVLLAGLVLALIVWAAVENWGPGAYGDKDSSTSATTETAPPATAPDRSQSGEPGANAPAETPPATSPSEPSPSSTDTTPQTVPTQPSNGNGATGSAPPPQNP